MGWRLHYENKITVTKIYLILFLFLFGFIQRALADNAPIIVDAEFSERRKKQDVTILKGNVNVIFNQKFLRADEAHVYSKRGTIEALGNVVLQSAASTIYAEKIIYNYETNEGESFGARIISGQTLLQGDKIRKIDENTFIAENAYYTACVSCPPAWHFTAQEVEAKMGDSAIIKNSWFHIWEFPILPLPYLVVPLNANRKTGFLFPIFGGGGDGGVALQVPFFWAINRSTDATLSAKWYKRRGFQFLGNYRYMLSPNSGGELNISGLVDSYFKSTIPNQSNKRWFLNYSHYFDLSDNLIQRTQINLLGDVYYPMDFRRDVMSIVGEPSTESHVSLTKNFLNSHLSIDTTYNISLLDKSTDPNLSNAVHKLPEIRYTLTDQPLLKSFPLYGDLDFQYINFFRSWQGYDDYIPGSGTGSKPWGNIETPINTTNPANIGTFNYGPDIIRSGQRIDIQPSVSAPFWLFKKFDISPTMAFRFTQYYLNAPTDPTQGFANDPQRYYLKFSTSAKTYFTNVFNKPEDGATEYTSYKHYFMPEINFNFIPWIQQSRNCFFTAPGTNCTDNLNLQIPLSQEKQPINDTDLAPGGRGLQFDYRDRITGKRTVEFGFHNKLMQRTVTKSSEQYKQMLLLRLSQAFDFEEASRPNGGFPWQDINGLLQLNHNNIILYSQVNYYPYHNALNTSTSARAFDSRGRYVNVSYNKFHVITPDPANFDPGSDRETIVLSGGINIPYLTFSTSLEYNLKLHSASRMTFSTDLIPPGNCWKINAFVSKDLGINDLVWGVRPEFTHDLF